MTFDEWWNLNKNQKGSSYDLCAAAFAAGQDALLYQDDLATAYEEVWQSAGNDSETPVRYSEKKYMQFVVDMVKLGASFHDHVNSEEVHVPAVIMTDPSQIRQVTWVPCGHRKYTRRLFLVFPS